VTTWRARRSQVAATRTLARLAAELETVRRARRACDDAAEQARTAEAQACAAAEAWQAAVERTRLALVRGHWRRGIGL
jgi:hypothetical protein